MSKLDNMKLMCCCANGAGSSLMMQKALEKVLKKYNAKPREVCHNSVSDGVGVAKNYDAVLCAKPFAKNFDDAKAKGTMVLPLKNVMSDREIEEAFRSAGLLD